MLKKFPGWKQAEYVISADVKNSGYGKVYTHRQLDEIFGINPFTNGSIADFNKYKLEVLNNVNRLKKSLLENHNIFLSPIQGTGYTALHPNDQVTKGADKCMKKVFKNIRLYGKVLLNVDEDKLDPELKLLRNERLVHNGRLLQMMKRKKLT